MEEKFTYRKLKEILSTLTDEQLDNEVFVETSESYKKLSGVNIVQEDLYYDNDAMDDEIVLMTLKELLESDQDITEDDYIKYFSEGQMVLLL